MSNKLQFGIPEWASIDDVAKWDCQSGDHVEFRLKRDSSFKLFTTGAAISAIQRVRSKASDITIRCEFSLPGTDVHELAMQQWPDCFLTLGGVALLNAADHMFTEMVEDQGPSKVRFDCLSIYGFANTPESVSCFARLPAHKSFLDKCKLCESGSIPVHIDPASYHLKSRTESPVMLTRDHLHPGKTFIERYRDTQKMFFVHQDDRNDLRHHAFSLNMLTLLAHPVFEERLDQKLKSLQGQVELVVAPNHEAGRKLADATAREFGCRFIIHDTLERSKTGAAEVEALSNARKVLIVDDVVNTGSRLKRYIQSFREGGYGQFDVINYLVDCNI